MAKETMNALEAAEYLHLKLPTIYNLVSKKKIPFSKPAGRLLFLKKDLDKWIETKTFIPEPADGAEKL